MTVDIKEGQKTGGYLVNKITVMPLNLMFPKTKPLRLLFKYQGGFGLHAAYYGAKTVTCVDVSKLACENIIKHAKLNHFTQVETLRQMYLII